MLALLRMLSYLLQLSRDIRFSRALMVLSAIAGVASGLASVGMMAIINRLINHSGTPSQALLWTFAGLCIGLPSLRYSSQLLLTKLTQDSLTILRMRLTRSILGAPLRRLEIIGAPKLLATLTGDVGAIVGALGMIPVLLMHLALVVGSLSYMGWLSWRVLLQTLAFMGFGIFTYRMATSRAMGYFYRMRELQNDVMERARGAVEGSKELKMHKGRREAFLESTEVSVAELQRQSRAGTLAFAASSSWGQALFFVLIGLLVIVLPRFQPLDREVLVGYTLALFQLMSPIEVLMGSLPALSQAAAATEAVRDLGFSLESESSEKRGEDLAHGSWEPLELVGVTHSYKVPARWEAPIRLPGAMREAALGGRREPPLGGAREAAPGARREPPREARREPLLRGASRGNGNESGNEEKAFLLGPIDLTFHSGDLVFIVGGNGSGKTTLAKIILGLYVPESGEIRRGGQAVTDHNREEYRQSFSAVFSDSFIFQTLFGLDSSGLSTEARRYLEKLHLEQKVKVENGGFSTVYLSQGQRKRLALLTAYIEDRPIYFFDEWAADQDPVFKKIFYYELLPELKSRGKTIFVISHDDHYFHVADRIVKLNYGQIEFDNKVKAVLPVENSTTIRSDGRPTA